MVTPVPTNLPPGCMSTVTFGRPDLFGLIDATSNEEADLSTAVTGCEVACERLNSAKIADLRAVGLMLITVKITIPFFL